MAINAVDIVAAIILLGTAIRGWRAGGIVMVGNILSLIAGFVVTAYVFSWLSGLPMFENWQAGHPILTVVAFIVVLSIVVKLLHLVVALLNQLYRIIALLPLLGPANRLIGATVGAAEGALVLLVMVYLVQNVVFVSSLLPASVNNVIASSTTFNMGVFLLDRLQFLIPQFSIYV